MRLNKYIAHNSKYSRRDADKLIADESVMIRNKIITDFSYDVVEGDRVFINGKLLHQKDEYTIIIYNKVKGELVTRRDDRNRKTIFHTLPTKFRHFRTIGRLDYASEGLILLSDNVEMVTELMSGDYEREYIVKFYGTITEDMKIAMGNGLEIDDSLEGAHELNKISTIKFKPFIRCVIKKNSPTYSTVKVTLQEGKNRELRRFFAHFNREVLDIKRLSYAGISLNALPSGKWRYLTKDEYKNIRSIVSKN